MPSDFEVTEILEVLDEAVFDCTFPAIGFDTILEESSVAVRLHVFSSKESWLIVFERLMYLPVSAAYVTETCAFSTEGVSQKIRFPIQTPFAESVWNDGKFVL